MEIDRLRRWLVRSIAGGVAVELHHRGSDDVQRLVRGYPLRSGSADEVHEIARDLLADAQDETDVAEVRSSFVIRTAADGDKTIATTKLRLEPIDRSGAVQLNAPEEANREGVLRMLMTQNARMHQEICAAPSRQRAVYEEIIRVQGAQIKEQREELNKLYALLASRSEEESEIAAQLAADTQAREEAQQAFMGTAAQLLKHVTGISIDPANDAAGAADQPEAAE